MRKQLAVVGVLVAAFVCTGRLAPARSEDRAAKAEKPAKNADSLNTTDKQFLTNIWQSSLAEVKLSEAAQEHAKSEDVKAYAKQIVDDHTKANEELKKIAG